MKLDLLTAQKIFKKAFPKGAPQCQLSLTQQATMQTIEEYRGDVKHLDAAIRLRMAEEMAEAILKRQVAGGLNIENTSFTRDYYLRVFIFSEEELDTLLDAAIRHGIEQAAAIRNGIEQAGGV